MFPQPPHGKHRRGMNKGRCVVAARALVGAALIFIFLAGGVCLAPAGAALSSSPAVQVSLISDEADAVLAILAARRAGKTISQAQWQRLFSSEGYTRLKKRELQMGRPFEDAEFREFVLSDSLATRAPALEATLKKYRKVDVSAAGKDAMSYLPKDARIRAKIYPVIKPKENSFVFEVDSDPAIFLFLNPEESREKFENTLIHELHHIGYGSSCPPSRASEEISHLPPNQRSVLEWLGAFGEGFAMLAAAGGPDTHPHACSSARDRARWDADVANFNQDLKRIEGFLLDLWEKRLTGEEEIQKVGFSFFGEQGPWYTVGWRMAVVIEKTEGHARLIEVFCDERELLATYNEAAARNNQTAPEPLALWSNTAASALSTSSVHGTPMQPEAQMPTLQRCREVATK